MNKKYNVLLTMGVIFAIVLSLICPANIAKAQESTEGNLYDYNENYYDSYEEAATASEELMGQTEDNEISDSGESVEASDYISFANIKTAGTYLRKEMVARKSVVYFTYKNPEGFDVRSAYYSIRDEAFKHTGVYNEGDYLMWNWGGTDVQYKTNGDGSITYKLSIKYLSSAYQEKQIDAEVSRLLNNEFAGWQNMHDYQKVRMVYAWMTSNYQYVEGSNNHSTYSAIINHRTVCQGFATSMYRLLGEMGLSVRVIANDVHGWNIVQLGRYWYSLDATWDVGYEEPEWLFFLLEEEIFTYFDHYRSPEYDNDNFHKEHPMAGETYDYSAHKNDINIDYRTHVQTYGWQGFKYDGAISGTTGEGKRLEGIEIRLQNIGSYDLGVEYRTHIQKYGWETNWKKNGQMSGTSGEAKRLEAIQIRLTGADADKFDVWYRVHAQTYGWLGWAKNGQEAGTAGQSKRLESIQILVLPKGQNPEGVIGYSYIDYGLKSSSKDATKGLVNYKTHVQSYGWQGYVYDGSISGTSGKSKRLEGINISLGNTGYEGGIRYTTHVQSIGWQGDKDKPETWFKDGEMAGTSGKAKRLEGIRIQLYGEVANHYDVYYRVHAQSYGWLDWAKNGADAGTAGLSKRLEAIQIVLIPKGGQAPGSTSRPFVSR